MYQTIPSHNNLPDSNTDAHAIPIPFLDHHHNQVPYSSEIHPLGSTYVPPHRRLMNLMQSRSSRKSIIKLLGSMIIFTTLFFLSFHNRPTHAIPSLYQPSKDDPNGYAAYQTVQVDLNISNSSSSYSDTSDLDPNEINRRILNASPILGFYDQSHGELADWMSVIPDEIPITRMSIPGTHDSATWNYTRETQKALEPITGVMPPSIAFRCQDQSLFQMLGDGIRFFDLRVGFLPDHEQIGFYHASALLSSTATLPDVLLGFYKWLDDHPSETILISIKVDNATFQNPPSKKQPSSLQLQEIIYRLLTQSNMAKSHWFQEDSKLGTLGESRGKLIFIQRIDWEHIRNDKSLKPIGIPLPPSKFNENDPSFTITYNNQDGSNQVYVEDFFNLLPNPTPVQKKIEMKFDAIKNHFKLATSVDDQNVDSSLSNSLFITFTSGGALGNIPPVTPKLLAIGTGEGKSLENSVNGKVLNLIQEQYKNNTSQERLENVRLGIVIFDWYHQLPTLIHELISLNPSSNV